MAKTHGTLRCCSPQYPPCWVSWQEAGAKGQVAMLFSFVMTVCHALPQHFVDEESSSRAGECDPRAMGTLEGGAVHISARWIVDQY